MTRKQIKKVKEINDYFAKNRQGYTAFPSDEDMVGIEITWGDWKHDHLYVNQFLEEKFGLTFINEEVTEENGTDTYSSIHYFKI